MKNAPCRKFSGTFVDNPGFWNNQDPGKSIFFDALSILIPLFEQFVLTSIIWHRHTPQDPHQKKALKALIAQERQHLRAYQHQVAQNLQAQGAPIVACQQHQMKVTSVCMRPFSKSMLLCCTVATEHWTAILADTLLRHPNDYLKEAEPTLSALWYWHAIEEIEHKAVAFELQKTLKLGFYKRIAAMLCITFLFGYFYWRNVLQLVRFYRLPYKTVLNIFMLWCGRKGLLTRSLGMWCTFFKPSFHPWTHQPNADLLKAWYPKLEPFVTLRNTVQKR